MSNIPKVKVTAYYRKPYTMRLAPSRWQLFKFRVRQFIRFMTYGAIALGAFVVSAAFIGAGVFSSSTTTYATQIQTVEVPVKIASPVLNRIGDCESGERDAKGHGVAGSARQFDKYGQVILYVNTGGTYAGTVDVGKYGINKTFWGKKAGEMGFNIFTEEGNTAMANYLYENYGTEPWAGTSGSCWKK